MTERVSVVGLGKLGLCLAACFAKTGIETIGVDVEEHVVQSVNKGISPLVEPGLQELISSLGGKQLRATLSHQEAIDNTDMTFILVATPSNQDGTFSNRYVESTLQSLSQALARNGKAHHLFVISSTVAPGSTENSFVPLIEKHSKRTLHSGFDVCYDPDFVALGDVVRGFLEPELIVIGETRQEAGERLEALHGKVCQNHPHIARMSIISAELAKVSLNAYITLKISFANVLANICEKVPGADVDAITRAIGVDKRISPYYFNGGLSFGGTCFPRDTKAFIALCKKHLQNAELIETVERVNEFQDQHLAELVLEQAAAMRGKSVGILGLSFKANTPVITESPAIKLITRLLKHDLRIVVYDPLAMGNTKALFNEQIEYVSSAKECLECASYCVITNRLDEYRLAAENYASDRPLTILDCWRLLDPAKLSHRIRYIAWGYAPQTSPGRAEAAAG